MVFKICPPVRQFVPACLGALHLLTRGPTNPGKGTAMVMDALRSYLHRRWDSFDLDWLLDILFELLLLSTYYFYCTCCCCHKLFDFQVVNYY